MRGVVWTVVGLMLCASSFAFLERLTSGYIGTCVPGDIRCAGIAVQECINGKWFFKKVCVFGQKCDPDTKTCVSQRVDARRETFSVPLKTLEACKDGASLCERPHVFMYCRNNRWQREICKTGFKCNARVGGCKPSKPVVGVKYQPRIAQTTTIQRGESKYQPPVIKRYTTIE